MGCFEADNPTDLVQAMLSHHASLVAYLKQWERDEKTYLEDLQSRALDWKASDSKELHDSKATSPKDSFEQQAFCNMYSSGGLSVDSGATIATRIKPTFFSTKPSVGSLLAEWTKTRNSTRKRPSKLLGTVESVNQMCSQLKMPRDLGHQLSNGKTHTPSNGSGNTNPNRKRTTFTATGSMKSRTAVQVLTPRQRLKEFLDGARFESINGFIIVLNTIFLILDAERLIDHGKPLSPYNDAIEWTFCVYYIVEMCLRIGAEGLRDFVQAPSYSWRLLDLVIVGTYVFERASSLFLQGERVQSFISLRTVRVVKCVHSFRIIKILRAFRELRMMTSTISCAAKPLMWSLSLMFLITIMFGTCFLQATANFVTHMSIDEEVKPEVLKHWGSLSKAMSSLYMAVTGGDDWKNLSKPLEEVGWVFNWMLMFYIAFYTFVIVNTLTSTFVATTLAKGEDDDLQLILNELKQKERHVRHFTNWFERFDADFSGDVSIDEFNAVIEEPEMEAFAARMGVDVVDMQQFFTLLSGGGKYLVNLERFVLGCIKLKGNARSLDLMELIYWYSKGTEDQRKFERIVSEEFLRLKEELGYSRTLLQALAGVDAKPAMPELVSVTEKRRSCLQERRSETRSEATSTRIDFTSDVENRYRVWSSASDDLSPTPYPKKQFTL